MHPSKPCKFIPAMHQSPCFLNIQTFSVQSFTESSICTPLILNPRYLLLSPYQSHFNVKTCSTLTHSSCKLLAFIRDLITPTTLLQLATFLQHFSPVPDLSIINPKYLSSRTCYIEFHPQMTSNRSFLSPLLPYSSHYYLHSFSDLFCNILQQNILLLSHPTLIHSIISGHMYTRSEAFSILFPDLKISLTFSPSSFLLLSLPQLFIKLKPKRDNLFSPYTVTPFCSYTG